MFSYLCLNSVPAIEDPNTGITLWESGAIIEYLVDLYDKESKLTFPTAPEKYHVKQFLYYQMSGQGPYFGQASWFVNFHPERLPSAIQRYQNEVKRVIKVLDTVLKNNGDGYLVGGKCTYADLSFLTWARAVPFVMKGTDYDPAKECPSYGAWIAKLLERPAVKKVYSEWDAAMGDTKPAIVI